MSLSQEMVRVRALRGLGESHLQKLAALAQPRECPEGALLFREGDASEFVFVLLSGEVVLEVRAGDEGRAGVYAAAPGELLGWSPVLGRHAMTATARAATPCRLAALGVAGVEDLVRQDPHFGVAFLRQVGLIVSDRLSATRRCLAEASVLGRLPQLPIPREGSD
jgi:CRP-like cAMP-binding protein